MKKKVISLYSSQGLGNQLFNYTFIKNLYKFNYDSELTIKLYFNRKSKSDRNFLLNELIDNPSNRVKFFYNNKLNYF